MKFFDSVSFAGSYIFMYSAGATRGSCGTEGARYTKKGLSRLCPSRNRITWSACSRASLGPVFLVSMLVVKVALAKVQALPLLPMWKVTYPASFSTLESRGVPGGTVFALMFCGQCQS